MPSTRSRVYVLLPLYPPLLNVKLNFKYISNWLKFRLLSEIKYSQEFKISVVSGSFSLNVEEFWLQNHFQG